VSEPLELSKSAADVLVPDGLALEQALARTTHLGIGAHADDLELFAFHGIARCFRTPDRWFTGVTVTCGGGSSRAGPYAGLSDEEMRTTRRHEQRKAAIVGEYGAQLQLAWSSAEVKEGAPGVAADLLAIFKRARPEVVYVHNPADKHDTHVAVLLRSLSALRALPKEQRPKKLYGYEGWRDLDWLLDEDKQVLPVDEHESLGAALMAVHDAQISGGKRYDLAAAGRRRAHASFFEPRAADTHEGLSWAMDLTPLMEQDELTLTSLVEGHIERLRADVRARLRRLGG